MSIPASRTDSQARPTTRSLAGRGALIAGLGAVVFVTLRLVLLDGDPTAFVRAGDVYVDRDAAPSELRVLEDNIGYDGQFFYRLALDPFSDAERVEGITLGPRPESRQQRILYPLGAYLLSAGGRQPMVGWTLILVNVALMSAVGWLGTALAVDAGRSWYWGLVFAANPAYVIALGIDTAEIAAGAALLAALLALRRRAYLWATLAAVAALLSRETTLLLVGGIAAAWFVARVRPPRATDPAPPASVWVVPAGLAAAWQLAMRATWGHFPFSSSGNSDLGWPLAGLADRLPDWWPPTDHVRLSNLATAAILLAVGAVALLAAARSAAPRHERFALLGAVVLMLLTTEVVWIDLITFARTSGELFALATLVILSETRREPRPLLLLIPGAALLVAAETLNLS